MAFARGQLMQVVKAGESAKRTLETMYTTPEQRRELLEAIKQGKRAEEILREAGVNI
jgi:hypothetical protein